MANKSAEKRERQEARRRLRNRMAKSTMRTAIKKFDAAVAAGAKGIVAAGTGNGSISEREEAGLVDAMKKGVTVVRSARVQNGPTTASVARWQEEGILFSQALNPQKARMLLQLALTKTQDPKKIQEYFDKY